MESYEGAESTKMQLVKSIVMPHLESVEEGRIKAAAILEATEETGELLDPAVEQMNTEDEQHGLQVHPNLSILHHDDLVLDTNASSGSSYISMQIESEEVLLKKHDYLILTSN